MLRKKEKRRVKEGASCKARKTTVIRLGNDNIETLSKLKDDIRDAYAPAIAALGIKVLNYDDVITMLLSRQYDECLWQGYSGNEHGNMARIFEWTEQIEP